MVNGCVTSDFAQCVYVREWSDEIERLVRVVVAIECGWHGGYGQRSEGVVRGVQSSSTQHSRSSSAVCCSACSNQQSGGQ